MKRGNFVFFTVSCVYNFAECQILQLILLSFFLYHTIPILNCFTYYFKLQTIIIFKAIQKVQLSIPHQTILMNLFSVTDCTAVLRSQNNFFIINFQNPLSIQLAVSKDLIAATLNPNQIDTLQFNNLYDDSFELVMNH